MCPILVLNQNSRIGIVTVFATGQKKAREKIPSLKFTAYINFR